MSRATPTSTRRAPVASRPMDWTAPADLKAQLSRQWQRGDLLRALDGDAEIFPLRLKLKRPSSADIANRFEEVRVWATALAAMPRVRLEWQEIHHRVQGMQRLPSQVWVDSFDAAVSVLGKRSETERWAQLVERTRTLAPLLLPWITRKPLQALALADRWDALLAVVQWRREHPEASVYLRQIDVPGVHSKFIEEHQAVLAELFTLALPVDPAAAARPMARDFSRRFGFLVKPTRIRFRVLDERIHLLPGAVRFPDVTLDGDSFAALEFAPKRVFITENEVNFLAFPQCEEAIVIFGSGYGWEALAKVKWLAHTALHYWGDIDTHGFAILDRLRLPFPHVQSMLMDHETLYAHELHWGTEPDPNRQALPRLTASERDLFDDLRDDRIRKRLRLEQERIAFGWVTAALEGLG